MSVQRWERITEIPLLLLGVVFLLSYSAQVLLSLDGSTYSTLELVNVAVWVVFGVDFGVRFLLASGRWRWFARNVFDFLVIILPALRPLRLLRLATVVSIVHRTTGAALRVRILTLTGATAVLLVYVASLAVLDAERTEGTITTFGDALWWAIVTVTTVGYGDYFPVTVAGKVIAVGLMAGGLVLVGIIVGTLSSWIVEKVSADVEETVEDQLEEIRQIRAELGELRSLLLGSGSAGFSEATDDRPPADKVDRS